MTATPLSTETLKPDADAISRAAAILRAGGLVAFPTETVYGLGADATNDDAVSAIYTAKGRPSFNPLIVHVSSIDEAKTLTQWSDTAERLARAFWPGPLTLVLPLRDGAGLSRIVTAGLDTLAVRLPATDLARALFTAVGRPVAAPSANPSGQVSATTADHVLTGLGGRIDAVIDGGACQVGLESTILGLSGRPTLLRPGGVSARVLGNVLGAPIAARHDTDTISAPGQLASHYAPNARLRLNALDWHQGEARLGFGSMECDLNLSPDGDLSEAAANLFAHLRMLDDRGADTIAVAPIPHDGIGLAINDRLSRAAAPRG